MLERLGDELRGDLGEQLHEHLTRREVRATQQRVAELLRPAGTPSPAASGRRSPGRPSDVARTCELVVDQRR